MHPLKFVTFYEGNSGGHYRLTREAYAKLQAEGWWPVYGEAYLSGHRIEKDGWPRPTYMKKKFKCLELALAEWSYITGLNPHDTSGCDCCGDPYDFESHDQAPPEGYVEPADVIKELTGHIDFMRKLLHLSSGFEDVCISIPEHVFIRATDADHPWSSHVVCSDVFVWGSSDLEPLTPENIDQFIETLNEAYTLGADEDIGCWLFACRMRKRRPQKARYCQIPEDLHKLFNECGPSYDGWEAGGV